MRRSARCAPHDQALRATGQMKLVGSLGEPNEAVCLYPRDTAADTSAKPEAKSGPAVKTGEPLGAVFLLEAAIWQRLAALHPGANLGKHFGDAIESCAIDHVEQV